MICGMAHCQSVCLLEHHKGRARRLRLILTSQDLLTSGEKLLMDKNHPAHGSGLLFGCAADRCEDPDWLVNPMVGVSCMRLAKEGVLGSV